MRTYAAVDIGSNSVRLSIGRVQRGRVKVIHTDREVTRLGEGVFRNGSLDPAAMAHTINVLKRFRRATQKHAVDQVRVVATSATRDAKNARVFSDWVHSATSWELEVITGLEEGRLIHLGVVSNARTTTPRMLLIDVGGGSCELTLSNHHHIQEMVSLPLGAVRLTQEFLRHDPPKDGEVRKLKEFITEELSPIAERYAAFRPQLVVATSGSAAALTAAAGGWLSSRATTSQVRRLADELGAMTTQQRAKLRGINAKRAEIIIAGAEVFAQILSLLNLRSMRYLPLGLRDGLLAQMAADGDAGAASRIHLQTEREDALLQLAERYDVDVPNAKHVRTLCTQLFNSLRKLHGLPGEYANWIEAAAMLQEIGAFVNNSGRHRHAYYLIAHSELFGYTAAERNIVAAIARYQGKSRPTETDRPIRVLPPDERERIRKAVVLLRLARALNQSRNRVVREVSSRTLDEQIELRLATKGRAELERWAIEREVPYFREVFGRELLLKE